MTNITSTMLADMQACRENGESVASIAARYNVKPMTAYQRLRRTFGLTERLPGPANDNNPNRVTRMVPRNGGFSTVSGMVPTTLVRLVANDSSHNDADMKAGELVNSYALKQVAA